MSTETVQAKLDELDREWNEIKDLKTGLEVRPQEIIDGPNGKVWVSTHKWGTRYHGCSYDTYLKMKEAHKLLLRAYCDCKRYWRWHRKDNKAGPEPKCPVFMADFFKSHMIFKRGPFYGKNLYTHTLEQYQVARRSHVDLQDVHSVVPASDLDGIVAKLKGFYAS